jgi:hypothetical protein
MIAAVIGSLAAYAIILGYCWRLHLLADGPVTIRRLLLWVTDNLLPAPRAILDKIERDLYLCRWYLIGGAYMEDGSSPWDAWGDPKEAAIWLKRPFTNVLHRFHRSDAERWLHNHPFKWMLSVCLAGGMIEERWDPETGEILRRKIKPWSINLIRHNTYHRVQLTSDDCLTFVIIGPRVQGWGFLDMTTGRTIPWREYFEKRKAA